MHAKNFARSKLVSHSSSYVLSDTLCKVTYQDAAPNLLSGVFPHGPNWHFGIDKPLLLRWVGTTVLCIVHASNTLQIVTTKISPDITKCPLGGKAKLHLAGSSALENHSEADFKVRTLWAQGTPASLLFIVAVFALHCCGFVESLAHPVNVSKHLHFEDEMN